MASFKSYPILSVSLLVIGAVTIGQIYLMIFQRIQTKLLAADIEQRQNLVQNFIHEIPFPSRSNQIAIAVERKQVEKTREEIRNLLRADTEPARKIQEAKVPSDRPDAYFDLANFVEKLRAEASRTKVIIAPDNRFGFASYANTGPEQDVIPLVFIQRQYAEYLMIALLTESAPAEFVSLQRERPTSFEQKRLQEEGLLNSNISSGVEDNSTSGDYFVIDRRISAKVPGFVDTVAFRIVFTGGTDALRRFLNKLAAFDLPVVVRSVEVAALNKSDAHSTTAPTNSLESLFGQSLGKTELNAVQKPLVEPTKSRFTVTVEFLSLVDKNSSAAPTP
jgi:hypothetical protein